MESKMRNYPTVVLHPVLVYASATMTPTNSHPDEPDSELRIEHEYDDETPPSIAIIHAIAIIENIDPVDLLDECGIALYDYINPEALDRLATANTEGAVTIDLTLYPEHEYTIHVGDTGQLVVRKVV